MSIDVLLFAAAREAAGRDRLRLDVPDDATVGGLFAVLAAHTPALAPVLPHCRAAVDERFAARDVRLSPGSVVAVLPPVSGG
jgi:molybdopterin converting factor subunit 1